MKQNLHSSRQINYFTLQQQSKDQLLLQGPDCLTLLRLHLLIMYNELAMLSLPSFHFIVFFLQVFWSKFTILLKFFSKKTNHFWTTPSTLLLSLVSLSSCYLVFFSLQIFPLLFAHFLSFLFFVFDIDYRFEYLLWFCFYFLQSSLYLQEIAYFQGALHPLDRYLWGLILFLICTFPWG